MAPLVAPLAGLLGSFTEPQFATWFRAVFVVAALLLLLILVGIGWRHVRVRTPLEEPDTRRPSGAGLSPGFWALGLALVLGTTATLNLVVDPYGMYGSGILAPVSMQMRRLKAEAYAALPNVPQVVVLGSSIGHPISPAPPSAAVASTTSSSRRSSCDRHEGASCRRCSSCN